MVHAVGDWNGFFEGSVRVDEVFGWSEAPDPDVEGGVAVERDATTSSPSPSMGQFSCLA